MLEMSVNVHKAVVLQIGCDSTVAAGYEGQEQYAFIPLIEFSSIADQTIEDELSRVDQERPEHPEDFAWRIELFGKFADWLECEASKFRKAIKDST